VAAEQAQVDRRTDKQLNFQTRSLLCVPLVNEAGQCLGAFELINKIGGDFSDQDQQSLEQLAKHAAIAIANRTRVDRLVTTQKTAATEAASSVQFRGSCDPIRSLKKTILRVAPTELSVLLLGENGTGKEVAAQLLHFSSERRDEVLIAVNCAAIPENLLESELFGHEKGAFTDAQQTRQGKFELASLGTIFLDEIGDMSLAGQAKLLRVLEEKTIVRVGGSQTIPTNSRVVAATNQNLAELVRQRKFREDLFFRLNVVTLEIPPLRIRGNDILELAQFFMETFSVQARRNVPTLSLAVQKKLLSHPWPGNVRELRNMMERLVFLTSEDRIEVEDLSFITSPSREANTLDLELPLNDATRLFQIQYITQQIQQSHGSMTLAAQRMGLHRTNLYRKMKQLGLSVDES
jgi:Nif-specific regulatory protein